MAHSWEYLVYSDDFSSIGNSKFYPIYVSTLFSILGNGGLWIAAISFFLFGKNNSNISISKLVIALIGILTIEASFNEFYGGQNAPWQWDIYSYILLSFIICLGLVRRINFDAIIIIVSAIILAIPHQIYFSFFNSFANPEILRILTADLNSVDKPNGWFVFPWIFIPIGFFSLGQLVRKRKLDQLPLMSSFLEVVGLILFLILAGVLFFIQDQSIPVMLGPKMYQFMFWQHPIHFWQHLLLFLLFLRLAINDSVNQIFRESILSKLHYLRWIRSFWLCYFLQFGVLQFVIENFSGKTNVPGFIDFIWIPIFLITELLAQIGFYFKNRYSSK
jgi:hypothetical protein